MAGFRIITGFLVAYLLMFIAAAIPYAGPLIVGALGTAIARCDRTCGAFLGFTVIVLYAITMITAGLMIALGLPDAFLNGLFAAMGGYFMGRIFEENEYY
jgi:predicted PurR-regulated permease PerM